MPAISPLDVLADELGAIAGRIERELRHGFEAAVARLDARIAGIELAALRAENERELRIVARLAELKDGRDGTDGKDADIAPLETQINHVVELSAQHLGLLSRELTDKVNEKLAAVKDGKDGENGKNADVSSLVEEIDRREREQDVAFSTLSQDINKRVDDRLAELRDGRDGEKGDPGESIKGDKGDPGESVKGDKGDKGDPGEPGESIKGDPGERGAPGKLPLVKEWTARVHYEGDVVTRDGSTYQAVRDTGGAPPGEDWQPLATKGVDARGFRVRGTFNADKVYEQNDVIALGGSSFVAVKDEPGRCPGEGWQLLASAGKPGGRGQPGESIKGEKGEPGEKGASIVAAQIDPEIMVLDLVDSDGEKLTLDLEPFAQAIASK